jgi:hypothetical protein
MSAFYARCNVGITHGTLGNLPEQSYIWQAAQFAESLDHPNLQSSDWSEMKLLA